LEDALQRLQGSVESLVSYRRELSQSSDALSKSLSMIASCEENTALARTLSKLAETHENLSVVQKHECEQDTQLLSEVLNEHLQLTQVLKELFYERVKAWQQWQTHHQNLAKKREIKARFDLAGNAERARQVKTEVEECEQRVDGMEKEFLQVNFNSRYV
jgi:sorting nexin-1/2